MQLKPREKKQIKATHKTAKNWNNLFAIVMDMKRNNSATPTNTITIIIIIIKEKHLQKY